jgi:hypothetical protein
MIVTERNFYSLVKVKMVFFANSPFDISGCDAVRFSSCEDKLSANGFFPTDELTAIIDLRKELDSIFNGFSADSTRRQIKRAEEKGIKIGFNEHYEEFYEIYTSFKERKEFGHKIGTHTLGVGYLKKYGTLFTSVLDGEVLGGHLYIEDEDHMRLFLSGSKRLEVDKEKARAVSFGNRLTHWEAMKYAKSKGIKEFDFGGLDPAPAGSNLNLEDVSNINKFKLSFGSIPTMKYAYLKGYSRRFKLAERFQRILEGNAPANEK